MQIRTVALFFFASLSVYSLQPLTLHCLKTFEPLGPSGCFDRAAATDHRHQERRPRPLEIADDLDAVELAIQDREADLDPGGADLLEQLADDLGHRRLRVAAISATV